MAPHDQRAGPSASIRKAAATISTVASQAPHLVERDHRRVHAVHRALGLREQREDRERTVAHGRRDTGGIQPPAHVCQSHVAVAVVRRRLNVEAHAGERRIPVPVDGDGHRGRQIEPRERRFQAVGERRPGIQQRRSEHVTGDPAHRIEVKARETVARRRTLRYDRVRVRRRGGRCVVQGYSPLKAGLRFSANEATPSAKSTDERSLP